MQMSNYFDYFDMVYFINLPIRTDRYDNMINLFSKLNITNYKKIVPITDNLTPIESCLSSHIQCIDDAINNNYDNICIFEDDVCFNQDNLEIEKNLDYHLSICFDFLKNNKYDLFYFDNMLHFVKEDGIIKSIIRFPYSSGIQKITAKLFGHSYAVSKSAFLDIKNMSKLNLRVNIDELLYMIRLDKKYMYGDGIFDQSLSFLSDL